jgi:hypothetical protein
MLAALGQLRPVPVATAFLLQVASEVYARKTKETFLLPPDDAML